MKFIRIKMKFVVVSMLFFIFILPTGAQTANNCYAVLLNGGIKSNYNHVSHYYNLQFVYETLINEYNYNENQVFVLNSDGTDTNDDCWKYDYDVPFQTISFSSPQDIDGDGDNDINGECNLEEIEDIFDYLESTLTTNDFLFIFFTGAQDLLAGSAYYLWDNPWTWNFDYITDSDIADFIDQVNAGRIVVLSSYQKSGSIIDNLEDLNRVVFTNCASDETGNHTEIGNYEEYLFNFFSAVAGDYPQWEGRFQPIEADENNDGYISLQEAHLYAIDNITQQYNAIGIPLDNYTPQTSSDPSNLWENMTLLGEELCVSTTNIHDEYYYNYNYSLSDCNFDIEDVLVIGAASLTIEADHDIIIQSDMEIYQNSHVTLSAGDNVIIQSNFEIELGSSLTIN